MRAARHVHDTAVRLLELVQAADAELLTLTATQTDYPREYYRLDLAVDLLRGAALSLRRAACCAAAADGAVDE